jgi:biopolymer transport protein ExbB
MDSVLSFLMKGGWLMVPIGLCSLVSLAVVLERFYSLRQGRIVPRGMIEEVKRQLSRGHVAEALELCQRSWQPISRILEAGILKHRRPRAEIKETIEDAGRVEVELLERNLDLLTIIANVAPLLGLLGTVNGLIEVFDVINDVKNVGDPSILAGGISVALITTAAGLGVAIPTMLFHHHFYKRAQRTLLLMEKTALEVLEILVRTQPGPEHEYGRVSLAQLDEL